MIVPGTVESMGTVTLRTQDPAGSRSDLQVSFIPGETVEEPYLLFQALRTRLNFSGLFLGLPAEDRSVLALATFVSSPTEGYPDSALLCREAAQVLVK